MNQWSASRGFTMIETLVSTSILLAIMAGLFALLNPARGAFRSQSASSDLQQQLRVGAEALRHGLLMAGAGSDLGPARGPLHRFVAPVLPRRVGRSTGDPPDMARSDAVTAIYVPATVAQATLRDPLAAGSEVAVLQPGPGCPTGDLSCGFAEGGHVLIFDAARGGSFFTVTSVEGPAIGLRHRDSWTAPAYPSGTSIVEIASHTYYLSLDQQQLRLHDGFDSDLPMLDNVVELSVVYFGEPAPPLPGAQSSDPENPATTYGPAPPDPDVDVADGWPAGENCVFMAGNDTVAPRLPWLGPAGGSLVPLAPAMLDDGPWCPDAAAPNRFDADLLRVRRVRVSFRLQAADASLRGSLAGSARDAWFRFAGTGRDPYQLVPDLGVQFDVSPRNLNLGR
jgi:hypothetical protein